MASEPLHEEPLPFITLPNWIKAAAQCGFNIQPIFRELGIQTDLVHLESATIARPLLEKVMERCVERSRKQHFPFVLGESFAFEYLPDLETFLTTSPSLREAAKIFEWVRELINPLIRVTLEEDKDEARLVLKLGREDREDGPARWFTETMFAAIVKFGRMLLGGRGDYRELRLSYPRPRYAKEYRDYFGIPVKFGCAEDAAVMDRALLDQPLEGAFPALHEQAQFRVEQRLQRIPRRTGLIAAIEDAFARKPRLLGLGIDSVAAEIGLHPRTLQRRLRETGSQYAELQGRVRYRLAMRYLEDPHADIEDISERLGFSDRRSFTRAFRRWSGVTPSAFRARRPGHTHTRETG
ncbi:MAG TPA: AraC family transcriptional regulator ligand-binding domain-containing protein [Nevskiaceae bacterium]|nr:AraC family transcriptional regulator ligand-binding domain-containing protein [Nevskiaceae bacterium]